MKKPKVRIINHVARDANAWPDAVTKCISAIDRAVSDLEATAYDLFGTESNAKMAAVKNRLKGVIG